MNRLVNQGTVERVPRRVFLSFLCEHCGSRELAWRSRLGHGRTALIHEILIVEGNVHPILLGEYQTGPATENSQLREQPGEWTCGQCGRPVVDSQGLSPSGLSTLIRFLWEKRRDQERSGTTAEELTGPDTENSFLFQDDADECEPDGDPPDLRCPECGSPEFIEQQEAVVFTPVQIVNGELTWIYGERCMADYWDGHETSYHCPKCGFEAPEPFDEWVERGCPREGDDD